MPRRGDNIRKRKDGRWEARYPILYCDTEKRQYASVYGKTFQEAKEKRETVLRKQISTSRTVTQIRFKDILCAWQDSNRIRLKESSVSRYQNLIDTHILPELGNCTMSQLSTAYLNRFIASKLKSGRMDGNGGLAASYVRSIALVIDAAIKFGVAEQLCTPLKSPITKPSITRKEVRILSKECQSKLENVLLADMNEEKLLIYIFNGESLLIGLHIRENLSDVQTLPLELV